MLPPVAAAAIEKLGKVPTNFWVNLAIGLGILFVAIFLIKNAMRMNKIVLFILVSVVCGVVGFKWVYERTEPEFLTPFIEPLAQFFPSKGAYEGKQQQDSSGPGVKKNAPHPKPAQPPKK